MNIKTDSHPRLRNWSRNVTFTPEGVFYPTDEDEIRQLLREARTQKKTVRVVGSGHSFTPLIVTNDILISLDLMQGLIETETTPETVTAWAGTKLHALGQLLLDRGLAMENLGDIDSQSIAGTISTGTHGTGIQFGSIATQVEDLTLVLANGEVIVCSHQENSEIFKAALTSLGALGVITRMKLRVVPAYTLQFTQKKEKLTECLAKMEKYNAENRNFEFYYFPYTDVVQTKFSNVTNEKPDGFSVSRVFNDVLLENVAVKALSEVSRWIPASTRPISQFFGAAVGTTHKKDWSHRIYAVPRWVRFTEMEYSLPHTQMKDALNEIAECIIRDHHRVHFPIECRFVKGDDIWLSTAHGRDSAYLAVHMYRGMDHRAYFDAMESIFKNHQGRPHWGKMHSLTAPALRPLYPQWDSFQKLRNQLDPQGLFLTPYLKELFVS